MSDEVLDPYNLRGNPDVKLLRQSTLGTADVCLKRLAFELDPNVPGGTGQARIVGTAYHAGLEDYYRLRKDGHLADQPYVDLAVEKAAWAFNQESSGFDGWDTSADEAWAQTKAMVVEYFDQRCQWPDEYEVVAVEQEWWAPLNEQWVMKGTIDLVLNDTQGRTVLADHKTAGKRWPRDKEKPRKNQQAVLYSWAWWRTTGEVPFGFCFDVMTYAGVFERRWSFPTPEAMTAVLTKAIGVGTVLDLVPRDQLPANTSSALCSVKYCDFWDRCPHGAALDQAA